MSNDIWEEKRFCGYRVLKHHRCELCGDRLIEAPAIFGKDHNYVTCVDHAHATYILEEVLAEGVEDE